MTLHLAYPEVNILRHRLALVLIWIVLFAFASLSMAQELRSSAPQELLDAAVEYLQSAGSFKLAIKQTGEPYPLALSFDGVNLLPATLTGAEAQYVSPNELHISALLQLFIPLSLDIYSLDDRQWLSFPSGAPWIQLPAFEDFDTNRLLAADDGIEYVMANLQDPQIVHDGARADEDTVWHLQARAAGDGVAGLLFGFIEPQDDVEIDAYIAAENGRFELLEIKMLETTGDPDRDAAVWHIRFYDYDAPRVFEPPR